MQRKNLLIIGSLIIICVLGCTAGSGISDNTEPSKNEHSYSTADSGETKGEYTDVNADATVIDVINMPDFEGFGRFLFPTEHGMPESSMKLSDIDSLLPYHNHININTNTTVDVLNSMMDALDRGETIIYNIYTDKEKEADPTKENTGLFFPRGEPDAPFAVISEGGGSVMDCCKAISLAARYEGVVWTDFWARPGVVDFEPLPLGVIVTVAGTGSECNGGAVITNEKLKTKTGRDYPKCNPKFALLDPIYTYSVPKKQMVSGSFDILSHIMEIYFSAPDENNVSDDIAEALMRNVIRNLRVAIQNLEDYTARSNLMWDATMAEKRIIKLGKRTDFECHRNISWARTQTAIMAQAWQFCPRLLSPYLRSGKNEIYPLCNGSLGYPGGRKIPNSTGQSRCGSSC
ncbi:iron-containing alcohol dehydrogenase [Lacrimispora sp.]|uniref:iron-containing alcohol dehydrogenase n=1 Tax=Lacrimispora sp. TaxID=2719234 RepID=UPI0032E4A142